MTIPEIVCTTTLLYLVYYTLLHLPLLPFVSVPSASDLWPSELSTRAYKFSFQALICPQEHSIRRGRLVPDGKICLNSSGELAVTKFAVEPAWYLPGVANRFGIGLYPERS